MAVHKRGTQIPRGVKELNEKLSEMGISNIKVFPGGKWKDLSADERADEILKMIESVERGEFETCDFAALEEMSKQ